MAKAETQIVYGIHAVQALLEREPERVLEVWIERNRNDKRIQTVLVLAGQHHVPLNRCDRQKLDDMTDDAGHQGVAARCKGAAARKETDLDSLLDSLSVAPLLLVLDGVQDPHNLGACLRTADAAGVHAVIIPKDNAASLTATVRKVASGAAESVPLFVVTNLARCLDKLKARNIWLMGAAGECDKSVYDVDLNGPLAIVMGAEGKGLRRLTRETCDVLMHIPMQGTVESLNVSVATGVCLYEALRQRSYKGRS